MWRKILTIVKENERVTEHAKQIDSIFGVGVPNMSTEEAERRKCLDQNGTPCRIRTYDLRLRRT